jgi:ankyrin repeat protein
VELRAEPIALAGVVEELESSGFVKFHRREGDTVIESLVLHDLARSFLQSKVSQDETVLLVASSFFLNGWLLYNGVQIPAQDVIRRHMGRLLVVLDMFLSQVPNSMLQPPDGKYFWLCASVAPLYARICRYTRMLDTAAQLWAIVLQHRLLSSEEGPHCPDSRQEDLMEAAEIDARLGNLADAIKKYSAVIFFFESSNRGADEMCIKAAGLLRESRERLQRRERDSGRAITAMSAPKNMRRDNNDDAEEESDWQSQEEYEEEEEEQALRAAYEEVRQYGLSAAFTSAQRLCGYYHLRNRPEKEAEYREVVWKYLEEEYGGDVLGTTTAFQALCDCYYAAGQLGAKIARDMHFALTWGKIFGSSKLVGLLLSKSAHETLESLALGKLDVIIELAKCGETDTALCLAALQPNSARDIMVRYLKVHGFLCRDTLLLKVAGRPWSGAAIETLLKIATEDNDNCEKEKTLALFRAIIADNVTGVSVLLSHGADVYHRNSSGDTLIHLAATTAVVSPSIFKMLSAHGASISESNAQGRTPLHVASTLGNDKVVSTLLQLGAKVAEADNEGKTALHLAVRDEEHLGTFLVEVLLQHGASVTQEDNCGRTAFHSAVASHEQCITLTSHADIVRLLVDHYQRDVEKSPVTLHSVAKALDIQDCNGRTALHEASKAGNRDAYNILIHAGANPGILDSSGVSAAFETEAPDIEERAGKFELFSLSLENVNNSNDQSHEQPAHQEGAHPAKTEDNERTGWRTRWRHWRQSSVHFRASRRRE